MAKEKKSLDDLQRKIMPELSMWSWIILTFDLMPFLAGILNTFFSYTISNTYILKYLRILKCSESGLWNYTNTMSTVIAAVVILYYTLQDNHREGIPHRTVVAYFLGVWGIPVFFALELLGMLFLQMKVILGEYIFYGMLSSVILLQLSIIAIILLTSSSRVCRALICKAEYRQLENYFKYEVDKQEYIWNYFIRHMGQVVSGDDMISDKTTLIGQLLKVPLRYKEKIREAWREDANQEEPWKDMLYEYFFMNMLITFEAVKDKPEEVSQIFSTLYEFVDYCSERCNDEDDKTGASEGSLLKMDYILILSAIMNAALTSGLEKANDFCHGILNQKVKKDIWNSVVTLYILYLVFLNCVEDRKEQAYKFEAIQDLHVYEFKEERLCRECWFLWKKNNNLPVDRSIQYLENALAAMQKNAYDDIISYFYLVKGKE